MQSPVLSRVNQGELCSGCGLCAGLSGGTITITEQSPGFLRPSTTALLSPETEQKLAAACPGARLPPWHEAAQTDPFWGPIDSCETGHATDDEVRYKGSSGGLISALAIVALEAGLVDAVIQTIADPERPTRNKTVVSRTRAEILAAAGSRYAPSSPLDRLEDYLQSGLRYCFIGKPCDVSALVALGAVDPRVAEAFPLRMSFFCGGIPSFTGTDRVVEAMGLAQEELAAFRYRGNGWPGLTVATTRGGDEASMRYAESWGNFLSGTVQYRCKICADSVGGAADIAAADAWYGGESGYPSFDEQDGRSLVLGRTAAGQALLQLAKDRGAVALEALPVSEISLMQPGQSRRKRLVLARLAAAKSLLQPIPDFAGLRIWPAARKAELLETIKNYLGSIRRIILGRR
jgi:coenzyme F420 hydrogenase subunit beta